VCDSFSQKLGKNLTVQCSLQGSVVRHVKNSNESDKDDNDNDGDDDDDDDDDDDRSSITLLGNCYQYI